MRRIAAKFVPRLLMLINEQKQCSMNVCIHLKKAVRIDPYFLSKVDTGDESFVYGYDPERRQQSSQWPIFTSAKKSPSSQE